MTAPPDRPTAAEAPQCSRCKQPKAPYPHDSAWWVCMTPGCWLDPERRRKPEVTDV